MVEIQEQSDPLLKVSEVARMFDVQPATVREWLNTGILHGVKIGKGHYWRVPTSAARQLAMRKYASESQYE